MDKALIHNQRSDRMLSLNLLSFASFSLIAVQFRCLQLFLRKQLQLGKQHSPGAPPGAQLGLWNLFHLSRRMPTAMSSFAFLENISRSVNSCANIENIGSGVCIMIWCYNFKKKYTIVLFTLMFSRSFCNILNSVFVA